MEDGAGRASRVTVVVEIEGPESAVLEEGTRLLSVVADELDGARLVDLRLDYDGTSSGAPVVGPGPVDLLDLVGTGTTSPTEAALWRLALRAAGTRVPAATVGPDRPEERVVNRPPGTVATEERG